MFVLQRPLDLHRQVSLHLWFLGSGGGPASSWPNTSRELAPRPNTTVLIKSESHALRTLLRTLQAPHAYFNTCRYDPRPALRSVLFCDPRFQLRGGHAISPPGLTRSPLQNLSSAPSRTCCRHSKMKVFSSDRRRKVTKDPSSRLIRFPLCKRIC